MRMNTDIGGWGYGINSEGARTRREFGFSGGSPMKKLRMIQRFMGFHFAWPTPPERPAPSPLADSFAVSKKDFSRSLSLPENINFTRVRWFNPHTMKELPWP